MSSNFTRARKVLESDPTAQPLSIGAVAHLSEAYKTIAALQAELAEAQRKLALVESEISEMTEDGDPAYYWFGRCKEARNECLEQARLLGMGAERELDLQARLTEAREVPGRIAAWLVSLDGPNLDADAGNAGLQFGVLMQAQEAIEARDWSK